MTNNHIENLKKNLQQKNFYGAIEYFNLNWVETNRYPKCYTIVALAFFENKDYSNAFRYATEAIIKGDLSENAYLIALRSSLLCENEVNKGRLIQLSEEAQAIHPNSFKIFWLLKKSQLTNKKLVLILGDSHASYFSSINTLSRSLRAKSFVLAIPVWGATAYGCNNLNSKSRVIATVEENKYLFRNADFVITYFGEVDCRRALWDAARKTKNDIHDLVNNSIRSYFNFLMYLKNYNENIHVFAPKPQIVPDKDINFIASYDERQPAIGISERQAITTKFINCLKEIITEQSGINYVIESESTFGNLYNVTPLPAEVYFDDKSDDTHGSYSYFFKKYELILDKLI